MRITLKSVFLVLLVFSGCSAARHLEDAPSTKFLDLPGVNNTSKLDNIPFQRSWVKKGLNGKTYNKVMIAPVNVQYVSLNNWEKSVSGVIPSKDAYASEVRSLGNFATEKLAKAFKDYEGNRFEVVATPGPDTFVLEMALTEVIFGNPVAAAGSMVAPIPGSGAMLAAVANPSVAFELRLRDAVTGEVLVTAADRGFPTNRLVNFNKLTATSACHEVVENSAGLIVECLNKGRFVGVDKSIFSLKPW